MGHALLTGPSAYTLGKFAFCNTCMVDSNWHMHRAWLRNRKFTHSVVSGFLAVIIVVTECAAL